MPHLVAAPDKFRGTATAAEVAAAAADAARQAGWTADEVPMSDGGEGLLDAVGGTPRQTTVTGPLGVQIEAEWRLLGFDRDPSAHNAPTAVVEMSRAAGRALMPHPRGHDPMRATTTGVGQLLLAARDAGAARVVIGCGGSATTDGGRGAYEVVRQSPGVLKDIELVVASDVTTRFTDAAHLFGSQKGATPEQIEELTQRLINLAVRYEDETGVDVTTVPGAGAAGGLAGGLLALGARIEPGFGLVAALVGLADRLRVADLVVTGEGHLDPPSFEGKVPGGVLDLARARADAGPRRRPPRVLCIAGASDRALWASPPDGMDIVSLTHRFGRERARGETTALIHQVTAEALDRFCL